MAFKFVRTNLQSVHRVSEMIENGETIDENEMDENEHGDGVIEDVDDDDGSVEDVDDFAASTKPQN